MTRHETCFFKINVFMECFLNFISKRVHFITYIIEGPIWFLAIIFPFFGPINSAVVALLVSFTIYIIPALAHMCTYRTALARQVANYGNIQFCKGS